MKHFLLFISAIIFTQVGIGQCLKKGITTNPAAPVNTELPSNKNLYFNWTQSSWANNSTCQPNTQITSPFYKTDNLEILRQSKDMQPQDGWELIRREFGYTDQNTLEAEAPQHVYFILYNKYTGILRVLLKTCRGLDYSGAKITIRFDATSSFQTSLLDLANSSAAKAVDVPFVKGPSSQSTSVYVNDQTKWFYADFPMTYDPCSCKYKAKLNVISQLIQNSQISLAGSLTGSITSITNGQGTVSNDGSYSFKDFTDDLDKFKKGYSTVDDFINQTKNVANTIPNSANVVAALNNFQQALKDNQGLKTTLAAIPWIGAAVSLVDLFIGGGKTSANPVQIQPLAVNLALKVDGTITTTNQYHNIIFTAPGSLDAKNDPDNYPFYNEILGVFNLMNGPVFNTIKTFTPLAAYNYQAGLQAWAFQLKQPIKWVLNPASNLAVQDAQVAYVVQSYNNSANPPSKLSYQGMNTSDPNVSQGFNYLEGKDAVTGVWQYRTAYVNFNCLSGNTAFKFQRVIPTAGQGTPIVGNMYLKLIINLKRLDNPSAQNVLLVLTYQIPSQTVTTVPTGGIFDPNACTGGMMVQATSSDINSFCASSSYTNNRANNLVAGTLHSPQSSNQITLKVFPNPVKNIMHIQGLFNSKTMTSIQVFNSLGQNMLTQKLNVSNTIEQDFNISKLPNGEYFIKFLFSTGESSYQKISRQ